MITIGSTRHRPITRGAVERELTDFGGGMTDGRDEAVQCDGFGGSEGERAYNSHLYDSTRLATTPQFYVYVYYTARYIDPFGSIATRVRAQLK